MLRSLIRWLADEVLDWVVGLGLVLGTVAIIALTRGRVAIAVPLLLVFVGLVLRRYFLSARSSANSDDPSRD